MAEPMLVGSVVEVIRDRSPPQGVIGAWLWWGSGAGVGAGGGDVS